MPEEKMGSSQIEKQQAIYTSITTDVVFDHISSQLLEQRIINGQELQKIKANVSESEQMSTLMDILLLKNPDYLRKFINILKVDYQWIADELENNIVDFQKVPPTKPSHLSYGVTNEMIILVQQNHRAADKWTLLAHSLGLSRYITDIRIRVNRNDEANSMCIFYLLQEWVGASSKQATLGNLLNALREQAFNDIADDLEEKYA